MEKQTEGTKEQLLIELQTLRSREGIYRLMFENMISGVALHKIVTDESGKPVDYVFLEVNNSFEQLTGLIGKEIIGKNVTEILPGIENDSVNWIETYGKVALKGEKIQFENYSEQIKRWHSIHAFCPKKGYFVTILEDVTEQRQIETELKNSEEIFRTIYNDSPDMYVSVSPIDTTILQCNNTLITNLGYSKEELIGSTVFKVYHEDCIDEVKQTFNQFVETGVVINKELILKRKDGSKIYVSLNVSSVKDKNGKILHSISSWRDISDRIIARKKFKHEKNKAQQYLDIAGVMLLGLDPNGVVQLINKKGCEILGYNEEEILGKNWIDNFLPEHELEKLTLKRGRAFEKNFESFKNYENKVRTKSGVEKLIAWHNSALTDGEGKIIGTLSSGEDITEKRQMEEELKKSEIKYKNLYKNAPLPYHSLDDDGYFLEVNPAWLSMLGYTRDDVIGKNYGDFLHPDWKKHFKTKFPKFKKTGNVKTTFKIRHKQGHYLDIELNGSIVQHPDGSFKQTNCVFQDITATKEAQRQLKENEERFRKLVEHLPVGIAIYQAIDNGKDFKFIDCNNAAELITNVTREKLIGRTLLEEFPNMLESKLYTGLNEVNNTGESLYIKPFYYEDKQRKGWRENNIYKLHSGELVAIFRDVTDLKTAAQKLKSKNKKLKIAKRKAEESDRLKSAFLANMSHEIRTPMNGILGFTNLLQEPNLTGEEQKAYIDIIQKSGNRMLNTVNDIIEISKIETGQVKIAFKEMNVNKQLDFLYHFFKPEVEKKGMKINMGYKLPENEAMIETDESKLNSILTNLIKNAIKYSNKGFIEIGCKRKKEYLEFTVKDTGIGIHKNRQEAIFERFVQADIEDSQVHEGSGLGLAITKSYIEMLGGEIWVESKLRKGSTFYFTIEYNPAKQADTTKKDTTVTNKKAIQKTILVAEDDNVSFLLLKGILLKENYNLIWAKNGKEAIELYKSTPGVDLILMDIKMPVVDGINATKQIRMFDKKIPILAQTAYALEGDKEKAIEAGCNDYISKPINRKELFQKINNAVPV